MAARSKRAVPRRAGADGDAPPAEHEAVSALRQEGAAPNSPAGASMLLDLAAAMQGQPSIPVAAPEPMVSPTALAYDPTRFQPASVGLAAPLSVGPTGPLYPTAVRPLTALPQLGPKGLYSTNTKMAHLFAPPGPSQHASVYVAPYLQQQQQHAQAAQHAQAQAQQHQQQMQIMQQMQQQQQQQMMQQHSQQMYAAQQQQQPPVPEQLHSPPPLADDLLSTRTAVSARTTNAKHAAHGSNGSMHAVNVPAAPRASPGPPASSPGSVASGSTKTSARRKSAAAVASQSSVAVSERTAERAERHDRSERNSSAGGGGGAGSGQPVDKHRKRLQRKAELARASRRRKKMYVGDLEGKCFQLAAQNAFLLAQINRRPDVLAHALESKLPPGLVLTQGALRSTIDLSKAKQSDDLSENEEDDDGDSGGGSENEVEAEHFTEPTPMSPPPPPPQPVQPAGRMSKREQARQAKLAAASPPAPAAAPHTDLSLLAHATETNPGAGSMMALPPHPHPSYFLTPAVPMQPSGMPMSGTLALDPYQQQQFLHAQQQQLHSPPLHLHPMATMARTPSVASSFPDGANGHTIAHERQLSDQVVAAAASSPVGAASTAVAAASPSSMHVVKALYHGELRRFSVPAASFTFPLLLATLEHLLLKRPAGSTPQSPSPLTLQYTDDEGDAVEVRSTHELLEALRSQQARAALSGGDTIFKLLVTDAADPATAAQASPSAAGTKRKLEADTAEESKQESTQAEDAHVKTEDAAAPSSAKRARASPQKAESSTEA